MDWGSILVLLGLLLITVLFVARPLLARGGGAPLRAEASRLSALQAELDQVLDALHELDQDHATGKLSEQDVEAERPELVARGAALLRAVDELEAEPAPAGAPAARQAEEQLEAAVRRLRARPSSDGGFCPNCGRPVEAGDRFCVGCGAALEAAEARA